MGDVSERTPLVGGSRTKGLTWVFATLCIVDLFGVFPVVALPRPIIECGWLGFPLALFVVGLQTYTAYLLSECWLIAETVDPSIVRKSRSPYSAIAELCFGVNVSRFVTFVLHVTIFGGGIPNLLVASQMLQLVGLKTTNFWFDLSFCYWLFILGISLCPLMWLGSPKDMKWLAVTSCAIVLTVAVLTWTSMIEDNTVLIPPVQPEPSWEAVAIAYGILAFQFDVHPMILTIQVDMDKKHKISHAILGGFAISGGFFLVSTALARYKYGTAVTWNLLEVIPGSGLLYANIVLVTLQICLSMVVGGSALFQELEDKLNIPRTFNWKRCALRSSLVFGAVMIAECVPRFDLIMGLIGGALTGPLMFLFPTVFYLKLRIMQRQHQQLQRSMAVEYFYEKQPPHNPSFNMRSSADLYYSNVEQTYYHKNCVHDLYRTEDNEELCFEPVLPTPCIERADDYYGDDFMGPKRVRVAANSTPTTPNPRGLSWCEKLSSFVIIVLGMLATVAATYYSARDTLNYVSLYTPCFL